MLIEFSVTNFRSFREKQTFSMVAAPRMKKRENVFKLAVPGDKIPDLLKIAAIYGPNASGKSNLINALNLISKIALRSPAARLSPLPVAPFRFDPLLQDQPSRIELHFVYAGQRYEFTLAVTSERIIDERLIAFPAGKETLLYDRRHTSNGDFYKFGELEGGKDLHDAWKKLTGPQILFIAQAVANSSEDLKQLRIPLEWLQRGMTFVSRDLQNLANITQELAEKFPRFSQEVSLFLQEVDVPVTDIRVDPIIREGLPVTLENEILDSDDADTQFTRRTTLTHKTDLGEAQFDFKEESDGTQALIGFWLPWSMLNSKTKKSLMRVLVVDELDSSLHPKIVAYLIKKHLQIEKPTQLIFTTHDTHLMNTKLLRRDQFWLTERDASGATQLRSIHDFEGRESDDLEKKYYEGRYRGLPLVY